MKKKLILVLFTVLGGRCQQMLNIEDFLMNYQSYNNDVINDPIVKELKEINGHLKYIALTLNTKLDTITHEVKLLQQPEEF